MASVESYDIPNRHKILEICSLLGQLRLVLEPWWEDKDMRNLLSHEHQVELWRHVEIYPIQELIRESNRKLRIYDIPSDGSQVIYYLWGPKGLIEMNKSSEDPRLEAIMLGLISRIESAFKPIFPHS